MFLYSPNQVPIFDGDFYQYWSKQIKTIFVSQDLWELVSEGYEKPPAESSSMWTVAQRKEYRENVKKDANALRIIHQSVGKSIFPRIFGVQKARDAWEILNKEFQGSEKAIAIKLQSLWRQFDNLSIKEGESIQDFYSRAAETINQIKSHGDNIEEKKIVERILRSLTPKFEHIVAVIEETKDLSIFTIHELIGSLEAHEQRMAKSTMQPLEQAFHSKV